MPNGTRVCVECGSDLFDRRGDARRCQLCIDDRTCADCGAWIGDRHYNARRCEPCSLIAKADAQAERAPRKRPCAVNDSECVPGRLRRGWCGKHYARAMTTGKTSLTRVDQFARYEVTSSGCWLWTGPVNRNGYGHCSSAMGDAVVHRAFYRRFVGPIPAGLELDHLCRVRRCVRPAHLEPVTRAENLRRAAAAARL